MNRARHPFFLGFVVRPLERVLLHNWSRCVVTASTYAEFNACRHHYCCCCCCCCYYYYYKWSVYGYWLSSVFSFSKRHDPRLLNRSCRWTGGQSLVFITLWLDKNTCLFFYLVIFLSYTIKRISYLSELAVGPSETAGPARRSNRIFAWKIITQIVSILATCPFFFTYVSNKSLFLVKDSIVTITVLF